MVVFGVSTNHGRYFVVKSALSLKAAVGLSARIEQLISRNSTHSGRYSTHPPLDNIFVIGRS